MKPYWINNDIKVKKKAELKQNCSDLLILK